MSEKGVTPRSEDYSRWYTDVVLKAELADYSPVKGCMVIRPYGYTLWENIQAALDRRFKDTGHVNAYFPLFIPMSFLKKEEEHVEGFAPELAVVTIGGGKELEEPLVVRPTSETIIGHMYSQWVRSYRDLPILINQWGNVVRWEMRTRLFLRTTEFLWQEGHTAHASREEAWERTMMMLDVYARLAEEYLALPVLKGRKTAAERFPGAVDTLCIEAMMQDRKALQAGTSHFLGQNFARASGIKFQSAEEHEEYVWTTSWGASTRLIGGVIMTHGDDDGIILPPRVASAQVVLLPIFKKEEERQAVMAYTESLARELKACRYNDRPITVEIDPRDIGGARGWEWIKKGIPLRVEIGSREIKENSVFLGRRDKPHHERVSLKREAFVAEIPGILDNIQDALFARALAYRTEHTVVIDDKGEFYDYFTPRNLEKPEIHGGFALSGWCGDAACEARIKEELTVTIRCLPFDAERPAERCISCGKPGQHRAVFAKAY